MAETRYAPRPVPHTLPGMHPVLSRVYAARQVDSPEQLRLDLARLAPPDGLPDLDRAVGRLQVALENGEKILFVGDYDADGATAVALGVSTLRAFGVADVDYVVPNRFAFGYGLSPGIVDFAASVQPRLLVTVDNGIASIDGVARARELGIDVIITDHHLPGAERPDACAVVNPVLPESTFPSRALAGVGVIFYVLSRLRARLTESGWFARRGITPPNMADALDLVALGTVADVVPLDHNNRILVRQGLARMRASRCRPGVRALIEVAKRDRARLTAADLGFALGPRLNAAGRLDDMTIGIRCLLATDDAEARHLAVALDQLNVARRELEQVMVADAELIVADQLAAGIQRDGVCVYDPTWHQGVVGIVAGRLKDRLHRPVIAFAEAGNSAPDELKGSARSIEGLHMRDMLDEIATTHPGLLPRFGGHAMAAGLSLKRVHFKQFASAFDRKVRERLPEDLRAHVLHTDGELTADELSLTLAEQLAEGGPWGQGFPAPLFEGTFDVVSQRVVGEAHLKLTLAIPLGGGDRRRLLDAIAFRQPPLANGSRQVRMAYRLERNDWGDVPTLQLQVEHLTPLS
ncbi:MAG: single-stranded-DNA-specific exonuclease RecJ [Pseudomonadales bacterium]|nr:single-stranded-DNA-specific exonuclease RecJ [Pseudomonadales bacterium]MCP5182784.1 single-stranded-DNA-specific exonuclease RecJ [Pseudomonadales bacterium]